jgi:hypothetical protein
VPTDTFDVLWGQSAWVHVADKRAFIRRSSRALKKYGRVAMEDAFLMRPAANDSQLALLTRLEKQWKASLIPVEQWYGFLRAESFTVSLTEDHTPEMQDHFERLLAATPTGAVPKEEAASWRNALRLSRLGLLTYHRIVAERAGAVILDVAFRRKVRRGKSKRG